MTELALRPPVVLITGVGGFIGGFLARDLASRGYQVIGTCRSRDRLAAAVRHACFCVHEVAMGKETEWSDYTNSVDVVIHAAAHVHIRKPTKNDRQLFRVVNIEGTRALVESCRDSDVKLFINLSSIAVNLFDATNHEGCYGWSKRIAEQVVAEIFGCGLTRYINLRLPAVYGPGMRGGLASLFKLVHRGLPLPIPAGAEPRSYLGVLNLACCIRHCISHLPKRSCTVAIADPLPVDLRGLITLMASATGRRPVLISVSDGVLKFGSWLLGREQELRRVLTGHRVDLSAALEHLEWAPTKDAAECWAQSIKNSA